MNSSTLENQAGYLSSSSSSPPRLSSFHSPINTKKKLLLLSMSESQNTIDPHTTTSSSSSSTSSSSSSSHYCYSGAITQMNDDFLISILQLLPVESIVSFSMTCRKFRSLGCSDALWESICRREWGASSVSSLLLSSSSSSLVPSAIPWKRVYQKISHAGSIHCSRLCFTTTAEGKGAIFPQPRASHSLNCLSNYLVLFGGGCEGGRHLDDTWVAHVGNGSERCINWLPVRSGTPTPSGRFGHTCTVVGSKLVLFGGINDNGIRQNDTWIGQVIRDGSLGITFSWETVHVGVVDPPPRGAHACCSVGNNKMLIHGGIGLNGIRLDDLWLLDLPDGASNSARWQPITTVQQLPSPPARSGHTLTWVGGTRVVLFGGRGAGYEALDDLWILELDGSCPRWLVVVYNCSFTRDQLPLPRVGHSATLVLGGRVLIYGGEDSLRHRKDDFWLLDVGLLSTTPTTGVRFISATVDSRRVLGKMWKRLKAEGQHQLASRSFHTACADMSGRRVYIFGGMVDGILHPAEAYGLQFDGGLHLAELAIK